MIKTEQERIKTEREKKFQMNYELIVRIAKSIDCNFMLNPIEKNLASHLKIIKRIILI